MLERLTTALTAADASAAVATLDDHVILRVAVHDQPFTGAHAARAILQVVLDGPLHDVVPVEHLDTGSDGSGIEVSTFTAGVAGYPGRADGLLVARTAAGGLIGDLTVYLRPLPALAALADEMGRRMGGPPPDGPAR